MKTLRAVGSLWLVSAAEAGTLNSVLRMKINAHHFFITGNYRNRAAIASYPALENGAFFPLALPSGKSDAESCTLQQSFKLYRGGA